ncbi:DUF4845 domain-containing protein [Ramlibacter sp. MAHUQ-53]|uniref:DUF4845 domain-containing protein n=1 Tax=unclassified Ramlibacter TaxID=2617605 RepID=UPI0036401C66
MNERRARGQRGLSFIGLVVLLAIIACGAILAVQLVPVMLESVAVQRAAVRAAAGGSPAEIRSLFDRAAQVDDISSITGKDLEVGRVDDRWTVSYAYQRELHLVGPAYLTMKYSGRAQAKP